jgi:hypothetical protein
MPNVTIPIFIGFDNREVIAYHVLSNSIQRLSSVPVAIIPVALNNLEGMFNRPKDPLQSTDFAFSRFLTPYLAKQMGFKNKVLFCDCDQLWRTDIVELWDHVSGKHEAVHVVKHDYTPKTERKFLGQTQTPYKRKNWSSFVVFDLKHQDCQKLTPEIVNNESGLYLHQFQWTDSIGELPTEYNWLVGEYPYNPGAKNIHFTLGGPWFQEYKDCDYAGEWRREMCMTFKCDQSKDPVHYIREGAYQDRKAVV